MCLFNFIEHIHMFLLMLAFGVKQFFVYFLASASANNLQFWVNISLHTLVHAFEHHLSGQKRKQKHKKPTKKACVVLNGNMVDGVYQWIKLVSKSNSSYHYYFIFRFSESYRLIGLKLTFKYILTDYNQKLIWSMWNFKFSMIIRQCLIDTMIK